MYSPRSCSTPRRNSRLPMALLAAGAHIHGPARPDLGLHQARDGLSPREAAGSAAVREAAFPQPRPQPRPPQEPVCSRLLSQAPRFHSIPREPGRAAGEQGEEARAVVVASGGGQRANSPHALPVPPPAEPHHYHNGLRVFSISSLGREQLPATTCNCTLATS